MSNSENNNTESAIHAGIVSASVRDRTMTVEMNGVTIPVILDVNGGVIPPETLMNIADKVNPPRGGRYALQTLASLSDWLQRFANRTTSVFIKKPTLNANGLASTAGQVHAVADDLAEEGGTRRALTAAVPLELSKTLATWAACRDYTIEQFTDLVESQLEDLASAELITASRNLSFSSAKVWKRTVDEQGNTRLTSEDTTDKTKMPREIKVRCATFEGDGPEVDHVARVQLRVKNGAPLFTIQFVDLAKMVAVRCAQIKETLELVMVQLPFVADPAKTDAENLANRVTAHHGTSVAVYMGSLT